MVNEHPLRTEALALAAGRLMHDCNKKHAAPGITGSEWIRSHTLIRVCEPVMIAGAIREDKEKEENEERNILHDFREFYLFRCFRLSSMRVLVLITNILWVSFILRKSFILFCGLSFILQWSVYPLLALPPCAPRLISSSATASDWRFCFRVSANLRISGC